MIDAFLDKISRIIPEKWRWILSHGGFRRYFKNTGWIFFNRIFILVLAFLVGIYVARYLGPEKYGILNYIVSFVGLFSFIPDLGISNILSRDLVKMPEKKDKLMGTAFLLQLCGGLIAIFFVGFFIAFVLNEDMTTKLMLVFVASTFFLQAFNIINIYFHANVIAKKAVIVQMLSFLVSSVLKVVFIYLHFDLVYFVSLYVFDAVFLAFGFILAYRKSKLSVSKWRFDAKIAKRLFKESWPLMLSTSFFLIYSRIDQIMIKEMMDNYSVGLYAVSAKLSEVWTFIPSAIMVSLFPAIINAKKTSQFSYEHRFRKLYPLVFFLSFFISLIIFLFARSIIDLLFGHEYLGAVLSLRIYVWSSIATALGFVISQYLIAEGRTRILFFLNFLSMAMNVILNLFLIPLMGIAGAALATLISYFMMVFGLVFFKNSRSHLKLIIQSIFLKKDFNKIN
jgi:O-antigen/teichoic acid export membrane protein